MKRAMTTILFVLLSLLFFSCGLEQNEVSQTWAEMEQKITVATLETKESANKGPYWIDNQGDRFICVEFENLDQWEPKGMEIAQSLILSEMKEWFDINPQFSFFEQAIPNDVNREALVCSFEVFGEFQVRVAYQSEKMTSIVLEGMINNKGAAHPSYSLTAYNFDPKGEFLSFEELYSVDDALYDAFAEAGEAAIKEENGGVLPDTFESFSKDLLSREKFLEGLREGSVQWFYTEEGVCFSYSVGHALGDHKEAVVPYSQLVKPKSDSVS